MSPGGASCVSREGLSVTLTRSDAQKIREHVKRRLRELRRNQPESAKSPKPKSKNGAKRTN